MIPPIPLANLPHKTPIDLALEILRRFVPSSLSEALLFPQSQHPRTTRTPPEALYGQEFFRAAHKVLNGHLHPSPEFGSSNTETGKGCIDLYIPGYKYGVEYLRNGEGILGHANRFLAGGVYRKWIDAGDIVDYILLDFRLTHPRNQHASKFKFAANRKLNLLLYSVSPTLSCHLRIQFPPRHGEGLFSAGRGLF